MVGALKIITIFDSFKTEQHRRTRKRRYFPTQRAVKSARVKEAGWKQRLTHCRYFATNHIAFFARIRCKQAAPD